MTGHGHGQKLSKLAFQCRLCEKIYKKPGMCIGCEAVLKPKAS